MSGGYVELILFREKLDILGPRYRNIEIVSMGPELAQRKSFAFGMNRVDAVLGDDDKIVPDVKTNHRMIDTVVGADPGNDYGAPAGAEIEFLEHGLHRGLIKTIMRGFLNNHFVWQGLEFFDKFDLRAVFQQSIIPAKNRELRMVL